MPRLELTVTPGSQNIIIKREFDAPRELVFGAHTDAKAIPQWWGPARYAVTVDRLEARAGGMWRFVSRGADGAEYSFHGVFHDLASPERITQTFEYEGVPGHVQLETLTLEDLGGRTRLVAVSVFQSVEDRDGMMQAGAEEGMREGYERLDALLRTMASERTPAGSKRAR